MTSATNWPGARIAAVIAGSGWAATSCASVEVNSSNRRCCRASRAVAEVDMPNLLQHSGIGSDQADSPISDKHFRNAKYSWAVTVSNWNVPTWAAEAIVKMIVGQQLTTRRSESDNAYLACAKRCDVCH